MSDLHDRILDITALEVNYGEGIKYKQMVLTKKKIDLIIALVRKHDNEKWMLHNKGVEMIKADEKQRCIDVANNLDVTVGDDGTWLISLYDLKQAIKEVQ